MTNLPSPNLESWPQTFHRCPTQSQLKTLFARLSPVPTSCRRSRPLQPRNWMKNLNWRSKFRSSHLSQCLAKIAKLQCRRQKRTLTFPRVPSLASHFCREASQRNSSQAKHQKTWERICLLFRSQLSMRREVKTQIVIGVIFDLSASWALSAGPAPTYQSLPRPKKLQKRN